MDPLLRQILRSTDLLPHCADLSTHLRITDKAGEKWVTLFGHPRDIPEGAAKARRETNSMSRNRDINRLQHAYWKYPEWFDGRRPWTAYIPDAACRHSRAESSTSHWMFADYVTTHEHLDTVCLDRVSAELCNTVLRDFTTLKGILNELQVYAAAGKPALPSDIPLVARVLDTYRGENESLIAVLLCREALIERLGAVSYGLHRVPDRIRSDIVSHHGLQLRVWLVLGCPILGVLLDLADPTYNDIPLLDFLHDGVPVHYPIDDWFLPQQVLSERPGLNFALNAENVSVALYFAVKHDTSALTERGIAVCAEEMLNERGREATDEEIDEVLRYGETLPSDGSPTPSLSEYALMEEIAAIQRNPLATMRPFLFPLPVPLFSTQIYWDESILNNAYLLIDELHEAKLRAYVKILRITEIENVLTELVHRGMSFQLAYRYDYLARRLVIPSGRPENILPPKPLGLLKRTRDPAVSWARYLARVRDLLRHPIAAGFLTKGGLCWRLALEFGPGLNILPNLLAREPPSVSSCARLPNSSDFVAVEVSEDDVNILLGKVQASHSAGSKSWWPSDELFPFNDFFVGEWTAHHERWFCRRLEDIASRNEDFGRPLTRHQWNRSLEMAGLPLRQRANEIFPTMRDIGIAREQWVGDDGEWNGVLLGQIPL